jgi:hypothetical protein
VTISRLAESLGNQWSHALRCLRELLLEIELLAEDCPLEQRRNCIGGRHRLLINQDIVKILRFHAAPKGTSHAIETID